MPQQHITSDANISLAPKGAVACLLRRDFLFLIVIYRLPTGSAEIDSNNYRVANICNNNNKIDINYYKFVCKTEDLSFERY